MRANTDQHLSNLVQLVAAYIEDGSEFSASYGIFGERAGVIQVTGTVFWDSNIRRSILEREGAEKLFDWAEIKADLDAGATAESLVRAFELNLPEYLRS